MYLLACTMPEARKRNSFIKGAIAPFTITIMLCDNGRASKGVVRMLVVLVGSYIMQHDAEVQIPREVVNFFDFLSTKLKMHFFQHFCLCTFIISAFCSFITTF